MMQNPVRQAREKLGLSRRQMCQAAGVTPATLYNAENGLMKSPPARLLRLLAMVAIDIDELLTSYAAYREHLATVGLAMLDEMRAEDNESKGNAKY